MLRDNYTALLEQALTLSQRSDVPDKCRAYVARLVERRQKDQPFTEAETKFLRDFTQNPNETDCDGAVGTVGFVASVLLLTGVVGYVLYYNLTE